MSIIIENARQVHLPIARCGVLIAPETMVMYSYRGIDLLSLVRARGNVNIRRYTSRLANLRHAMEAI